jgi:phage tail sheath protein FI
MKRLWKLLGIGVVVAIVAKPGKRARQVYVEEISAGARPIEAVGTAVAALVGVRKHTPPAQSGGASHDAE